MRIPVYSILVKSYLWIQVLVPETQTGMEPEQTQAAVAVAQPESEAVPETQSIEVTQTTSEMEVSREPSEVREEGVYVDSSAYLEATPSAAVVEESKPDDLVTQVVQPEKPVEPSGIEEEKEEEEEEVREREEGVEGMETVQHEAEPEKLVEQESVTGEQATLRLADTTQGETMVGGAKEAVEDEGGEGEMEERDEVVEEGMEEGEGVGAPVQEVAEVEGGMVDVEGGEEGGEEGPETMEELTEEEEEEEQVRLSRRRMREEG